MKVLAVDPGERVGWAVGTVTPKFRMAEPMTVRACVANGKVDQQIKVDELIDADCLRVENHGITALKPFALKLFEAIGSYDVVVYETYRISAQHIKHHIGSDVPTLQLIGMIRAAAWLNPQVKLVGQGPATKTTADRTMPGDLRARIDALPAAHDDSHDGDALRHLWFWHWKTNL